MVQPDYAHYMDSLRTFHKPGEMMHARRPNLWSSVFQLLGQLFWDCMNCDYSHKGTTVPSHFCVLNDAMHNYMRVHELRNNSVCCSSAMWLVLLRTTRVIWLPFRTFCTSTLITSTASGGNVSSLSEHSYSCSASARWLPSSCWTSRSVRLINAIEQCCQSEGAQC